MRYREDALAVWLEEHDLSPEHAAALTDACVSTRLDALTSSGDTPDQAGSIHA
jgi:hypothetical protein